MELINILVADDHSLILDGLCGILKKFPFVGEVMAYTKIKDAWDKIQERPFDVYILDLEYSDPEMDGFELIGRIMEKYKDSLIIVNTMHEEIWTVNRLIQLGVQGIVLKSSSSEYLEQAVVRVLEGDTFFCPRFRHLKKNDILPDFGKSGYTFPSKREIEVLQCIYKGMSTTEIAGYLSVSVNTVETHRKNLMLKLGSRNMAQLIAIAFKLGFLNSF